MEAAALRQLSDEAVTVSSLYGHVAETFSVMPLASIIAVALTRKMPRLFGTLPASLRPLTPASGNEQPERIIVSAFDPHGPIAAAAIRLPR